MWVVKIGGGLSDDPLLMQWLDLLTLLGGGRVALVCGGGRFAGEVRRAQALWHVAELPAHNMAVLAMAQTTWLAQGLQPQLRLARSEAEIRRVLHGGHTALWLPMACLRDAPDPAVAGEASADTIALELARTLAAERLVVVKTCAVDPAASLGELSAGGVLDRRFAHRALDAGFRIDVVHCASLGRMRSMLIGESA